MIFSFFLLVELFVAFTIERQRYIIILFFFLYIFVLPVSWFVRREPIISLLMTAAVYTTI